MINKYKDVVLDGFHGKEWTTEDITKLKEYLERVIYYVEDGMPVYDALYSARYQIKKQGE